MSTVDYYFSVLSPFAYLAGTQLETVAARTGVKVNYKPLDIMGLFAETGGTAPKDRHWSRQQYRLQELARVADYAKLKINLKPAHWPTDPLPASCAIIAAQNLGMDVGPLCHGSLRAVWAEERDIGDPQTVQALLQASSIDAGVVAAAMDGAEAQYHQNTQDAIAAGVFGAPTYVVDDQVFWGQDRLDYLERYLQHRK
ncbi:2-hydroxychromene-2-carboxylate isomerase [Aestuariirhabdus sp. LZHN29]|uniref:2-hydroxychromene-2-carboxylate isomerase n=1 Tax=Aestuariirhabdus sp. LZHN29 TaxID=3417462 RepID=UPI003CF7368D